MALMLAPLVAGVLSGCASGAVGVLNTIEPAGNVSITHGIAYAPGPRHSLDVYAPKHPRAGTPVVVFFYGGGWDSGDKAMYRFVGAALASHGYVAVTPDYRVYPEVRYPDFLTDAAQAVKWAHDHAAAYGGDPDKLFVMGHSAGAYNAAMLTLDRRWLNAVGLDPDRDIKGMVGLAGPYDFLPLKSPELMEIFGPEATRPATQPINYVHAGAPPMFLAHDVDDKVVWLKNTQNLAAKLRAAGDEVETRYYTGLDHARLVGAIATPLRFMAPVFADLTAFIDAQAARPARKAAA
jgi:acetyl esterase/lipase